MRHSVKPKPSSPLPRVRRPMANRSAEDGWRRASVLAAAAAGLVALVVLVGWATGRQELARAFTPVNMKLNTAIGITLLTASALLCGAGGRASRFAAAPALAAATLGAATLLEDVTGIALGIDELLATDPGSRSTLHPGRMSPVAATLLVAMGAMHLARGAARQVLLGVAAAAIFVSTVGYLLGVAPFYGATTFTTGVAPHTLVAFAFLVASALLDRPGEGFGPLLRDPGPAGYLARRLLPLAVLVPPGAAWIVLLGEAAGLYEDRFRAALIALLNASAIVAVAVVVIRGQARAQAERDAALAALRRSHEKLEERVGERTAELTRLAADLQRSNADLEQFAFVASHDLQAPLRQVSAFAGKVAGDAGNGLDARNRERLRFMVDGVGKMQSLIDALLELSRVGRAELRLEVVDPAALAREILDRIGQDLEQVHARVDVRPMPPVRADPGLVKQVYQNLVVNAVRYRRDAPLVVEIGARRESGMVRLHVRDNGRGVEPAARGRIFDTFHREHVDVKGSGLGLSIARRIVERHGGRMGVDSEAPTGSEFWFTLPAGDAGATQRNET